MSTTLPPSVAIPNRPESAARPHPDAAPAGGEASSAAIRLLQLLLVGTIVVPLLLGAVGGYFSYRADFARAQDALREAVAIAEENTLKVLDTHELVAARVDDLLSGLTDGEIRARERSLHERLAQQIKDFPQVAAAWAIDEDGRELVSARVYPVNRELDHSGREDFRALQNPKLRTYVWALRARSLGQKQYQLFFTVARRREGPHGRFRGIAVVAVPGSYFASFYNSLPLNAGEYTAGVFRDDGTNLARYPDDGAQPAAPGRDELLVKAIADRAPSGVIVSGSPFDGNGRVVAYKRVAGYPVYVTVGRSQASIWRAWLNSMWGYAAIGGIAACCLALLCLVALRRTRREQEALAQARDAVAQRAAVESQLHHAQKMEGVGQLTAGIAHDFNNLITIIKGNLKLLELSLDSSEPSFQKFIAMALQGCERATDLTGRLLSFSRRRPLDPRPVEVGTVIAGMADLLRRSLGGQIDCEIRIKEPAWPVLIDPNELENALLNLALNARDAMAGSGRLTIDIANRTLDEDDADYRPELSGECVRIAVADTGCGMPEEVRDKAFEPFFTTKEAGKGSGLGLSQVYGFVYRAGGHCIIDSEPGRGTTVKLYLPRYGEDKSEAPEEQPVREEAA